MSEILVVYYSRKGENHMPGGVQVLEKGNTAYAAEFIRDALNGDLFEIDTVNAYPENYRECCMQAVQEFKSGARPGIRETVDVSGYDTVFVCYPCWCGTAPMCVFTFLEGCDMTGKRIIPLCTHEGSGLANSEKDLAAACPGAEILPGFALLGHTAPTSRETVANWARKMAK